MSVRAQEMAEQLLLEKRFSAPAEIQGMCLDSFPNMVKMFFAITRCWMITYCYKVPKNQMLKDL